MPPIEIAVRRTTYTVGLVLSIVALAVTGGWVLPHLGLFPPVVVGVALTAVGVVTFAYYLATGPYLFRIDERGIHDRSGVFQAGRLGWDEIENVRVVTAEGRPQIGVLLTAARREKAALFARRLMDEQRTALGVDIIIAPEAMGPSSSETHVALLERFRSSPEARAELR